MLTASGANGVAGDAVVLPRVQTTDFRAAFLAFPTHLYDEGVSESCQPPFFFCQPVRQSNSFFAAQNF